MALPYESGFLGVLAWVGTPAPEWNVNITSWRLKYAQRMIETTLQGQSVGQGNRELIAGVAWWTAEIEFLMPATWTIDSGNNYGFRQVEVKLLHNTTQGYQFTALLGDYEVDCPLDGPVTGKAVLHGNIANPGLAFV